MARQVGTALLAAVLTFGALALAYWMGAHSAHQRSDGPETIPTVMLSDPHDMMVLTAPEGVMVRA